METGSSGDSEEKEDSKGKSPMEEKALSSDDSGLEQIIKKAGGIVIKEPNSDTSAESKRKAVSKSEGSKGKKTENVVKRSYGLRSHAKDKMDIDAKPKKGKGKAKAKAGKKRKGKELKRFPVESPERLKRRRDRDDEKDDQDGSGAYATRSSTKRGKVRSA